MKFTLTARLDIYATPDEIAAAIDDLLRVTARAVIKGYVGDDIEGEPVERVNSVIRGGQWSLGEIE